MTEHLVYFFRVLIPYQNAKKTNTNDIKYYI